MFVLGKYLSIKQQIDSISRSSSHKIIFKISKQNHQLYVQFNYSLFFFLFSDRFRSNRSIYPFPYFLSRYLNQQLLKISIFQLTSSQINLYSKLQNKLQKKNMNHSVSTMSGKTKIKIVFLGDQSVGKSSIIEKYIHDKFDETSNPTVGIDFLAKNISQGGKNYRLQLWDTAGQERFRSLIPSYLKDANCALITYDLTNIRSLENTNNWIKLYNENHIGDGYAFLVGNKSDLTPQDVEQIHIQKKCEQLQLRNFKISAKTGDGISDLFATILQAFNDKKVALYRSQSLQTCNKDDDDIIAEQDQNEKQQTKQQQQIDATTRKITQEKNQEQQGKGKDIVILKNEKTEKNGQKKNCC